MGIVSLKILENFCIRNGFIDVSKNESSEKEYSKSINDSLYVNIIINQSDSGKIFKVCCTNVFNDKKYQMSQVFSSTSLKFLAREEMKVFFDDYIKNIIIRNVESVINHVLFDEK